MPPSPRVVYGGIYGRVTKIWWTRVNGHRFALTIEKYGGLTMWLLWFLTEGQWVHEDFLEEEEEEVQYWFSSYGQVRKVARLLVGLCDKYMASEELDGQNRIALVVYDEIRGDEQDDYTVALAFHTLAQPNWSVEE